MKDPKARRQFLKNTALAGIALSAASLKLHGKSKEEKENLDHSLMCDKTTLDYFGEGPFYTDNPPTLVDNLLAAADEPGTRLVISGRVFNLDCSEFIPNTIIDMWHADDSGDYDNVGFKLRGQMLSNAQGFYMFETILPGKYLNGNQFRPSHIHFKITPPGFETLTTQLYFEGDTSIPNDAAASRTEGQFDATHRIIPLTENAEGKMEGTWDIVINGDGTTSTNDLHIDKGMLYTLAPNPFDTQLTIKYGVFKKAKVGLYVFDMQGRQVAILEERMLQPEKYEAEWNVDSALPKGYYFVALKINDLQVHYLKVQKI